ncbi:hypothetical protein LSTR_LSTR001912 [Laodelphax striatellus]|uniref:EF-hand domain-containing protein n=1 Tax=Laodelphax striatellus TaxID=195883 RepID=A0A482XI09_LAOST|nr:hypothetical protein LSTR_LSTR001912 [Laodelphax striatellus]
MRSLGMSPTIAELKSYLKEKGGKMSFPDFLKVMHTHSRAEEIPKEVVEAFRAADREKRGVIAASHLRHMLLHWGEQLSLKEVDQIFREANVAPNGMVKYEDFVKIACAPCRTITEMVCWKVSSTPQALDSIHHCYYYFIKYYINSSFLSTHISSRITFSPCCYPQFLKYFITSLF